MKTKYEIVIELTEQGKTCKEIEQMTGISLPSIYKYRGIYNRISKPKTIEVVKGHNKNRILCRTCIYRARDFGVNVCDYIEHVGHSRRCLVEDCDKYIKGARIHKASRLEYAQQAR